ncbi:isopentenyl diphosphate isomerase/L-lactate dehydrogenase-like FMN-dependent dehydrogenase [Bradyrhizobium sp. USDA 3311]
MCVGSQRVSLQSRNSQGLTRALRRLAPDIPLLANIGAAQLREADGLDLARRAVDALEADGLIVHLNPLQEVECLRAQPAWLKLNTWEPARTQIITRCQATRGAMDLRAALYGG